MCATYISPQIDADVFTTNPLSGEIDAVNEPDFIIDVSNAKLAIVIFVNPLPSPINPEPLAAITLPPVTNKLPVILTPPTILAVVLTSNPLLGEITASTEPDLILSNCKSSNEVSGILNNPLPSPWNNDADTGTLTNKLFEIIAVDEPD